jgi:hypothetical protein
MDFMEIVDAVILSLHLVVIGFFVLWFGFGKPKSVAQFRTIFKEQVFMIKKTSAKDPESF